MAVLTSPNITNLRSFARIYSHLFVCEGLN